MGLDALNLEPYEALIGPTVPQVQVDAVQIEEQPPALVSRPPSLAQMLRSSGKLDDDQIAQAEESARRGGIPLAQALVRNGLMLSWDLAAMTALHMGVPLLDLRGEIIDLDAVALLPEQLALHYLALPIRASGRRLTVAMTDPTDVGTMQDLSARTGRTIDPVIATVDHIVEHIDLSYRSAKVTQASALGMGQAVARVTAAQLNVLPPAEVMELLVHQALQDRASDVHLEPTEAHLRVRYRIDGILHDVMSLPLDMHPALISRLKIVSGLNIAERRRPQDGQFSLASGDRTADVRVAISSTVTGEMAVLRLLEKQFDLRGLDQLGMLRDSIDQFRKLLHLPYGIIIVCGPTGAGKSTTLYASVLQMDRIETNVISLEDPVEYHIADVNQMQVHPEAGVTFATQLRSILRLDPDV
ncbi:MAG: ATPase, T2SS/T4P/T4SS family, partial [Planctomycetota bacterium]|nr:ATPase, T2SS/T4P/T4SS family [Planctomycetota bacterium]